MKNAAWHLDGNTTVAEFETDTDSGYHDFKDGTHVVLDILSPKTDTSAYAPPGTEKPKATVIKGAANAQVHAIIDAAAQLTARSGARHAVEAKATKRPTQRTTPRQLQRTRPSRRTAKRPRPNRQPTPETKSAEAKTSDAKRPDANAGNQIRRRQAGSGAGRHRGRSPARAPADAFKSPTAI